MTATKTNRFRLSTAATIMLALLGSVMFVLTREQPASANHGTAQGFEFSPFNEPFTAMRDQAKTFDIFFGQAVTSRTLIMMEIESGSSDPDQPNESNNFTPDNSFSKPEARCYIATGEFGCTIEFTFRVVPTIGVDNVTARFYVNNHLIDTEELPNEGTTGGAGCDGVTGGKGGHESEPDLTEAAQIFVYGAIGGTPDAPATPPAGINVPYDCANPGGGGSQSPTPTGTGTGTGTPTPTGTGTGTPTPTPTPSDTGTGTPTPTPSDTGTGTPTPTPTNTGGPGGTFGEITAGVKPGIGTFGQDFTVAGEISCQGVKVANARVQIFRTYVGARTIDVVETATDVQGRYAFRDTDLRASADYAATWDGRTGGAAGASTPTACSSGAETGNDRRRALVRPGVIVNVRDATLKAGDTAIIYGAVLPAHPGKKVFLQVYHGQQGQWKYTAETILDSNSRYSIRLRRPSAGYLLVRVAYPTQDLNHVWNIGRTARIDWS